MSFFNTASLSRRFQLVLASFQQRDGLPFAGVLSESQIATAFTEEGSLFAQAEEDVYTPAVTLWAFLSQVLFKHEQRSCLAAVSRVVVLLVAACALIDVDGRVLLARRPEGKTMAGLWEFPGGKLAPGETPEVALIRELKEELGIDVSAACLAPFAFASHAYERFHLLMPLYLCRRWKGIATPRENQTLKWVRPQQLPDYDVPPADKPLISMLRDFL